MSLKKIIIKTFLITELIAFNYVYFFGLNGIQSLKKQKMTIKTLHHEIQEFEKELAILEKEIHAWQTNDFYKEKVAREQLQMARKGDKLFLIG